VLFLLFDYRLDRTAFSALPALTAQLLINPVGTDLTDGTGGTLVGAETATRTPGFINDVSDINHPQPAVYPIILPNRL